MSRITNDIITSLRKSLKANDRKTSAYDTQATIRRIEGNTAWVHIPGGVDETPVQLTINAKEGDQVQVRVSGGRAFLVGNATAPPTDDGYARQMSMSLSGDLKDTNKALRGLGRIVETVKDIASNTNQYFWHTETGTDTGAHITEIPQEEFLADPEHGGGNLLARSNGVAVRDGLDELSVFSADGARIGKANEGHMAITDHEIKGMNARGMHFDVVGPLYSETAEGEAFSWNLKRGGSYTNYPSYPSGTNVLLVKFGAIEESASISLDIDYYYGSATEQTYSASFTGGTTETKTNGSLFSVTYDASTDVIYLTSLSSSVHHSGGYAYANAVHEQINKLQFVFGKQSDEYTGGDCSASIGMSCEARGNNSLATGDRTSASGDSAFASGENTNASGEASTAQGASTVASGYYSHSEGYETEASGSFSHASGCGTVADGNSQTAVGKYNIRNSGNLFAVGNGTSNTNRSDAFAVDGSGNVTAAGRISGKAEALGFVRTSNSYVDATNFDRITGYRAGDVVVVNMNLALSAALPKSTDFVNIGTIVGYTFLQDSTMMVPAGNSTNAGVALVRITTGGVICLYNYSNTTIPSGSWLRCTLVLIPND